MISRRKFLEVARLLGITALLPAGNSGCSPKEIAGAIVGQNATLGHRLRTMDFGPPAETIKTDFLIIGGGVAGLSAARYLGRHTRDFRLLEMSADVGGNAAAGANSVSRFPWGAHYLPIPGNTDRELIAFLREAGVITGTRNGLPVYNEYYLCHDPKERLFINNFWQEGIVPHEGLPQKDRDEIQRFLELMNDFRHKRGTDQRAAFSIPVELSSRDRRFTVLDTQTAEEFLESHSFRSPYLQWYVNYCCADDFGSTTGETSAWAMIHYFASRNARALNAPPDAVLTWPEGNYWLVNELRKGLEPMIQTNALVFRVEYDTAGVACTFFDAKEGVTKQVRARAAIIATPQYINQRLISPEARQLDYTRFRYAPWMVANLVTDHPLDERRGEPLSWDNVVYGSDSLGYVNARHQDVGRERPGKVLTYYKPLSMPRKQALETTFAEWRDAIFRDIGKPHPELKDRVGEMNVWIWGHGMITPSRNFIWGDQRGLAQRDLAKKIFFAHSDLGGISIFEEAFYQGHKAATLMLES